MTVLYRATLDRPESLASAGERMRNLALRCGFSDLRATSLGVQLRELGARTARGASIRLELQTKPPSELVLVLHDSQDPAAIAEEADSWADTVEQGDASLRLGFQLPAPSFSPDLEWLLETQVWLAEQTSAELHQELARTNQELRGVLEHLRRQALDEANKARALQDANTRLEQMHKQEFRLARFDPVSKLPSRVQFEQSLAERIEKGRDQGGHFALLYLDLDFFKEINDTLGHAAGDQTLSVIGQRMTSALRESDLVGRLGGDEFGVILQRLGHPDDARKVASMLLASIREPIPLDAGTGHVDVSIGISIFPDDGDDAAKLMANADAAMYAVKRSGRGRFAFYSELTARGDIARGQRDEVESPGSARR